MTNIAELESYIRSAQTVIKNAEGTLELLKAELTELKEQQEKEKQPEPAQESLFGRWATHPEYGRGIIVSRQPDGDGEVRFAYQDGGYTDGAETRFARPGSLTLDPATLNTAKDFEDAPDGTIVEELGNERGVYVKAGVRWYIAAGSYAVRSGHMPTCRVIRWGNGK
ncbi:hypothetical protein I6H48_07585 [Corynebacterium amycolatum]|uniref:Uncharacterized protein n=1 Tax=Corynebacterium amycolatum TaxID=43765 RepID=A0AB37G5T1_CORAY|nr:hypothetical protein [Corynebacterium amycolatum]QPR30004.1 hypothetical protein I6G95_07025 [Corynebacterium amycolatum]QQB81840.1 hypothetical protein I6H48_07585 [Corynebacterium amycolatum]